jgi:hypothetical protein
MMAQDGFYQSPEWRAAKAQVFARDDHICRICFDMGSSENPLHVDHIKPRSKYPDLALDLSNLQILCATCNSRKGDRDYHGILDEIRLLELSLAAYKTVVTTLKCVHDKQRVTLEPLSEDQFPLSYERYDEPLLFEATVAALEKQKAWMELRLRRFGLEPSEWEAKRAKQEVPSDYPA